MNASELEQAVLEFVNRPHYKAVKPRVIAKKLGLDEETAGRLKKVVKGLVKAGKLEYGMDHQVLAVRGAAEREAGGKSSRDAYGSSKPTHLATASPGGPDPLSEEDGEEIRRHSRREFTGERVTGVFRRMGAGYGFVRPKQSAPAADRSGDIFVAANHAMDAASGDTVLVAISRKRDIRRPNPEGEIVEILERDTRQFVGTYFEAAGNGFVQVDGTLFSKPINVGDPGAKSALPDDKVVFEMVRFPSHFHDGEGVITEVLGAREAPGVDTMSVIREYNLPGEFPGDAMDEARRQAERFDESTHGRTDLSGETIITIDPVDAQRFRRRGFARAVGQRALAVGGAHRRCFALCAAGLAARSGSL